MGLRRWKKDLRTNFLLSVILRLLFIVPMIFQMFIYCSYGFPNVYLLFLWFSKCLFKFNISRRGIRCCIIPFFFFANYFTSVGISSKIVVITIKTTIRTLIM